MLVLALGFWVWSPRKLHEENTPPDFSVSLKQEREKLIREREEIARASYTPRQKVQHTARMADRLWRDARDLAELDNEARLAALSEVYVMLVTTDLPTYARGLAPDVRQDTLNSIRDQLLKADSELQGLLAEAKDRLTPETATRLNTIAQAARDGREMLGQLL